MPIVEFDGQQKWGKWLEADHSISKGVWLRIFKKNSGCQSVKYSQAVDQALCFGWIDGQRKKHDQQSFLQRFTPRADKSNWSKINVQNVERLSSEGRMREAGLLQVQKAKKDGRWQSSYLSQSKMEFPQELLDKIEKNEKAKANWQSMSRAQKYKIYMSLSLLKKQQSKRSRIEDIVSQLCR